MSTFSTSVFLRLLGDDYSTKFDNLATEMEMHYFNEEEFPSVAQPKVQLFRRIVSLDLLHNSVPLPDRPVLRGQVRERVAPRRGGGRIGRVSPKIRNLQDQLRRSQYHHTTTYEFYEDS